MIKNKMMFGGGWDDTECGSCGKYTHSIVNCPKIHSV